VKLGIIGDLHLEFGAWDFEPDPTVKHYVNAGDTSTARYYACSREFAKGHDEITFHVMGNHDFYHGSFPEPGENQAFQLMLDGDEKLTVAYATLWTDLDADQYDRRFSAMSDAHVIVGVSFSKYQECHRHDLGFLEATLADVVVTHHAPFLESIHPRWADDPYSCCFVSDLREEVDAWAKKPRLWVHGHVHDKHDYAMEWSDGSLTRVVCNPRGYRGETNYAGYAPVVVDV
jgi:hypothetical protein